jgi:hypothetical protein
MAVTLVLVAQLVMTLPAGAQEADPLSLGVGGVLIPFFGDASVGDVSVVEVANPVGANPSLQAAFFDQHCARVSTGANAPMAVNQVAFFGTPGTTGLVALTGLGPGAGGGPPLVPAEFASPIHARVYWFNAATRRTRVLEPITLRQSNGNATWNPLRTGASFFAAAEGGALQTVLYLICPKQTIQSPPASASTQAFDTANGFPAISPSFRTAYPVGSITGRVYDLAGTFLQDIVTDCDCVEVKPIATMAAAYTDFLAYPGAAGGTYTELQAQGPVGTAQDFAFTGYKSLGVPGLFFDVFGRLSPSSRSDAGGSGGPATGNR